MSGGPKKPAAVPRNIAEIPGSYYNKGRASAERGMVIWQMGLRWSRTDVPFMWQVYYRERGKKVGQKFFEMEKWIFFG